MGELPENLAEANALGVDLLLADLDTALTFMDVAQGSAKRETVERNHRNARKAYDTVVHLLPKMSPNAAQQNVIDAKLGLLKQRLEAVGQIF